MEGLTAKQIAALVMGNEAAAGPVEVPAEGSTLPQTYEFERGMAREAILARARAAMDKELAAAWAARASNLPLTSPHDLLTLASIVERETAKPEERPHIAAVYLNRLRQGMKLQADPTVAYGISNGTGVLDHKLNRADLETDTPLQHLSPRRACRLGRFARRAWRACARWRGPSNSEDLYFVADGSGGHAFARTVEAHNRNVLRWRGLQAVEPLVVSPQLAAPRVVTPVR